MPITVEGLIQEVASLDRPTVTGGKAGAEAALKARRTSKSATASVRAELAEKRDRWTARGMTARSEAEADRKAKAVKFSKGTSRVNLDEQAAAIVTADSLQLVVADVVDAIDVAIRDATLADLSADISLKMAEIDYFKASALESAFDAAEAWAPILRLEPNAQINLEGSRVQAWVRACLDAETELQKLIAERKTQ